MISDISISAVWNDDYLRGLGLAKNAVPILGRMTALDEIESVLSVRPMIPGRKSRRYALEVLKQPLRAKFDPRCDCQSVSYVETRRMGDRNIIIETVEK